MYIYSIYIFFVCVCVFVCARRKPIQLSACNVDLWRRTWPRCTSSGSGGIEIWKSVTSRVYCSCWKRKCPGNALEMPFTSLLFHFYITFINIKSTTIRVPLPAFLASCLTVSERREKELRKSSFRVIEAQKWQGIPRPLMSWENWPQLKFRQFINSLAY